MTKEQDYMSIRNLVENVKNISKNDDYNVECIVQENVIKCKIPESMDVDLGIGSLIALGILIMIVTSGMSVKIKK